MNRVKCPRCHTLMVQNTKVYRCPKCLATKERFIKPNTGSPLLLNMVSKNGETKKFLEDIARKPETQRSWYLKEGNVFIKENGKIVDVRNVKDFAYELAKEVRKK